MKHKSDQASRRYHNRVARQYDAMYDDAYWEFHDRLTWESIKPFLPRDAGAACCDLGCGTGKWGLKLLKSGWPTTFVDHSPVMIEQTRGKIEQMGNKSHKASLVVGDVIDLPQLPSGQFELIIAMGDVLSICSDVRSAIKEMRRIAKDGVIVIATADNKLAAADYYLGRADIEGLESFLRTGKTHWLTGDQREQFELTMFTAAELTQLFQANGFSVVQLRGKPILPVRNFGKVLESADSVERLIRMEMSLAKDPGSASRSSHFQIVAKKEMM